MNGKLIGEFTDNKTLDQVFASVENINNLDLKSELIKHSRVGKHLKKIKIDYGTIFQISNLRDDWEEEDINRLFKNLEVLIPPKEISDFKITLLSSKDAKKFGNVENSILDDYDYKLNAKFNSDKTLNIILDRREFVWKTINPNVFKEKSPQDMSKKPYNIETFKKGSFSYKTTINKIWPGVGEHYKDDVIKSIGSFELTFYFLKRSAKEDERKIFANRNFDANKRREWLDRFGGVKLFRDNFRVRPYGEIESNSWDWLELGTRAAGSTFGAGQEEGIGWKVNPNQIYGLIKISRINNPELKDTTNREGLVENKAFHAFQELILRLINVLEKDRHYVMRPMRAVSDIENQVEEAKEEAKKQAEEELEKQSKRKRKNKSAKNSKSTVYAKAVKGFEEELKQKENEIRMLRSLASIGMTISTYSHELGEIRRLLNSYSKRLRQIINNEIIKKKFESETKLLQNPFLLIEKIIELITRLSNWIDFSNQSIKKDRRKASDLSLSKYFIEFKTRWYEMLDARGVELIIDKSLNQGKIRNAFPIDMDSIFNNLLLNSMDAFYRKDSSSFRKININAKIEDKGIVLVYEDSGPGLIADIKKPNDIFEPFFTTKKKGEDEIGIGLGMWIVKTTVEQYNGYVEILKARPNFKIKIYFPKYSK
ncbi:MAG: sensor histidine kinase [Bacteroidia bacterium]